MWMLFRRFKRDSCSRTEQRLSAYIDRRLSPQELHRVELHLAACQGCQKQLQALQATVDLLHHLPQVSPSRSFRIARTEPSRQWTPLPALRLATVGVTMLLIFAFTADLTNLFDTSPSPVDQQAGTNFSTDNRSALSMEGDNTTKFSVSSPGGTQQFNPPPSESPETAEAGWVRPLEYGLAGVVIVLGGTTAWLWLRPKRTAKQRPA